jgi:hypothetical protein
MSIEWFAFQQWVSIYNRLTSRSVRWTRPRDRSRNLWRCCIKRKIFLDITHRQHTAVFYMIIEADCGLQNIVINKIRTMNNVQKIYRLISILVSSQKWKMQTDEHSFGIAVFSKAYTFFRHLSFNDNLTVCFLCTLYPVTLQSFWNWISNLSTKFIQIICLKVHWNEGNKSNRQLFRVLLSPARNFIMLKFPKLLSILETSLACVRCFV